MSRATGLHADLQKGIDTLAISAAGELDGRSDSIVRANKAFTTLLANKTLFSTLGDHTLDPTTDLTVKYLTGIPASDSTALNAAGIDANGVTWATKCSTLAVHQTLSMANSPAPSFHGVQPLPGRSVRSQSRMPRDVA